MIEELLTSKTTEEKADIKSAEIVSLVKIGEYQRKYKIEIVKIKTIKTGVEILARAWENDKQIGFGKDGTVDIERFRIFNPPILVPNGTRKTTIIDGDEFEVDNFKEDAKEALLQALEDIIRNVGKDGTKIIKGKIGNTTSTFYTDATTVDGRVYKEDSTNWDTTHDATTGEGASFSGDATRYVQVNISATLYSLIRGFFLFGTSAIGSDTINSATFSLYITSNTNTSGAGALALVQSSPAADNAIVAGDMDQCGAINNPTEGATRVAQSGITTNQYTDWTLNATGLSWVNGAGTTKLGLRDGPHDCDDVAPTVQDFIVASGSGHTGTTQDPKLVVVHTAANLANLKTYNTNVKANIKTMNTNPIANVKTFDTNA